MGILIVVVAVSWVLSFVGHPLGLTPSFGELWDSEEGFVSSHYQHVVWGYVLSFLFICAVVALAYLGYRVWSAEAGAGAEAKQRLTWIAYATGVLVVLIVVLPIGARDVPTGGDRPPSNEASVGPSGDDSSSDEPKRDRKKKKRDRDGDGTSEERKSDESLGGTLGDDGSASASEADDSAGSSTGSGGSECEPGYDPCVPPYPPDVDCPDVDGPVVVTGDDPHGLDGDDNGVGCQ